MTDAVIEFAKWVICEGVFQAADLDGLSIQEKALELGLLTKTKYDPEKHGEDEYAKPGSDWYVFSNLLTQTDPSPAPEAQQEPVAWGEFYGGKIVAVSLHKSHHYTVPLYTRPTERTVTEAWRPIETAPKDGTWVRLWRGHTNFGFLDPLVIGKWHEGVASWVWPDGPYDPYTEAGRADADVDIASGYHYKSNKFTHWMPLLTPPVNQSEGAGE